MHAAGISWRGIATTLSKEYFRRMPNPHRRLSDPRELNALAHPVRMAIIELLSLSGPLTTTELADRLDETPANCSWHIGKLALYGFVEEGDDGMGGRCPWSVLGRGVCSDEEHA
jgi:DNA-binding transcriptional ArsR family regulator